MQTGFRTLPVDTEFACRSARYLASQGYGPSQIRSALVEQLDITEFLANDVISSMDISTMPTQTMAA